MKAKLEIASIILAIAAAIYLLFAPAYRTAGVAESKTLVEINGSWGLIVLFVPIVISSIPLLWPRNAIRIGAAITLATFAIAGSLTVGSFFFPSAAVMILACLWPAPGFAKHDA